MLTISMVSSTNRNIFTLTLLIFFISEIINLYVLLVKAVIITFFKLMNIIKKYNTFSN